MFGLESIIGSLIGGAVSIGADWIKGKNEVKAIEGKTELIKTIGTNEQSIEILKLINNQLGLDLQDVEGARGAEKSILAKIKEGGIVAGINALVRPYIAITMFTFYVVAKMLILGDGIDQQANLTELAGVIFTTYDYQILGFVIGFYFAGRAKGLVQSAIKKHRAKGKE